MSSRLKDKQRRIVSQNHFCLEEELIPNNKGPLFIKKIFRKRDS